MFGRFTTAAREIVKEAVAHARACGAGAVGVEHLLLGVAAGDSAAGRVLHELGAHELAVEETIKTARHEARLLGTLGIDLDEVRASVERNFGSGAWRQESHSRHLRGFTPEARAAMGNALSHGPRMGSRSLDAEHILLGVLDAGGPATEVLVSLAVDPAEIRRRVLAELRAA